MHVRKSFLLLLMMLAVVPFVSAQDEAETEGATIPYFQTGIMNVPVPQTGWVDQSEGDVALFVNEDLSATIRVQPVEDTLLVEEAISLALAPLLDEDLPEPVFEGRVALNTGNWYQQHYEMGDTSITAAATLRGDRTFVILFWEDNPDYQVVHFIQRTPLTDSSEADFPDAIAAAEVALGGEDFSQEPDTTEEVSLISGNWSLLMYPDGQQLYAVEDGSVTYATLVTGEAVDSAQLADGFFTVFEGFFTTPDNSEFLLLGLAFFAIAMGGLLVSFWLRYRGARKDMAVVEQLAEEE